MPDLMGLFKKYYPDLASHVTGEPQLYPSMNEILSGKEAEVMTGDPGTAPGMAMIPTVKNLDKFRKLMSNALKDLSKDTPEEARQALAYLKARYPSMVKRADINVSPRELGSFFDVLGPGQRGVVNVGNVAGAIERKPLDRVFKSLAEKRAAKEEPLTMYLKTLSHELTHARQNVRSPEMLWEKYRPYVRSSKPVDDFLSFLDYYNQPAEKFARRGGETALKGFEKFLNMTGF